LIEVLESVIVEIVVLFIFEVGVIKAFNYNDYELLIDLGYGYIF
jgi:hypothetical protein